jgi:hypothetical protein
LLKQYQKREGLNARYVYTWFAEDDLRFKKYNAQAGVENIENSTGY